MSRPRLLCCCLLFLPVAAGAQVLAEIDTLESGDLEVRGFALTDVRELEVEATGLAPLDHYGEASSAWILDARSREVVWEMGKSTPKHKTLDLYEYEDRVSLKAGTYEVYYATFPGWSSNEGWWKNAARAVARFLRGDDRETSLDKLRLTVRGPGRSLSQETLETVRQEVVEDAVLTLAANRDGFSADQGFVLDRPLELEVYAVGEITKEGGYDYGWIIDAKTRKTVWSFTHEGSESAGGASKNRRVRESLRLPAGRYAAFFITDGSHSAAEWNSLPPHDPAFWGLTLWVKKRAERRYARRFDYRHLPEDRLIAELTKLRNHKALSRGVTLSEPMQVRVFAMGEGFESGMTDYGWIADARTRRTVWCMSYDRTSHAGGHQKNRMVDEVLDLQPGSYVVKFVTDDSHAYSDWNEDPPARAHRWGITLLAEREDFDPAKVSVYEEQHDPAIVARIAQVRDDVHETRTFSLERPGQVSIYALGEGTREGMYDYAWIEDADGAVVWEMDYPMTDGAGGAAKNRLYQGVLELAAGSYVLHYRSDDSHSFGKWNASPPHDPESWGIQVALLEAEPYTPRPPGRAMAVRATQVNDNGSGGTRLPTRARARLPFPGVRGRAPTHTRRLRIACLEPSPLPHHHPYFLGCRGDSRFAPRCEGRLRSLRPTRRAARTCSEDLVLVSPPTTKATFTARTRGRGVTSLARARTAPAGHDDC